MFPPATAVAVLLLLGSVLILLAWSVSRGLPPADRVTTLDFWCPFRSRRVTAKFQEDGRNGTLLDVLSCDAFTPPGAVRCDKLCLHLRRSPKRSLHTHYPGWR